MASIHEIKKNAKKSCETAPLIKKEKGKWSREWTTIAGQEKGES